MATFGITPVGTFPPPTADNFPEFLQWQQDGTDVGTTAVETINITGGASVSINAGGDTLTVDVGVSAFSWRTVASDYTLAVDDDGNGINAANFSESANTITIPAHANVAIPVGARVTLCMTGITRTDISPVTGVTLQYPSWANPAFAAQYSIIYLDQIATDVWVMSGDMLFVV